MLLILFYSLAYADTDGPWTLLGATGHSGEITINGRTWSSLFYWQFNAVGKNIFNDSIPMIIWLGGGPGCSGAVGMLGERISPIYIDDNQVPHYNNQTWAINYHILSIDFPYGAGFSFANSPSDLQNDTISATRYLYNFLQILTFKYPIWFQRDIYIFGESYGGHWVPALAYQILTENASSKITGNNIINLKGIGMGDPLSDALYQSQLYDVYSFDLGLSNLAQKMQISELEALVSENIINNNFIAANSYFEGIQNQLEINSNNVSIYNIRQYSLPDMGDYRGWLNLNSTKQLLNVPISLFYIDCNNDVYEAFSADIVAGIITPMMPTLLDNIKVLIYNGQDDMLINSNGVEYWISNIKWDSMSKFLKSRKRLWKVNNKLAGYAQNYGNMNFVQVLKAGHMSPLDQPVAIFDIINRFILNQGWD